MMVAPERGDELPQFLSTHPSVSENRSQDLLKLQQKRKSTCLISYSLRTKTELKIMANG